MTNPFFYADGDGNISTFNCAGGITLMKKNKLLNLILASAMAIGVSGSSGFAVFAEENPTQQNEGGSTPNENSEGQNGNNSENGNGSNPDVSFRNSGPLLGSGNGTTYTVTYVLGEHAASNAVDPQTKNQGEDLKLYDRTPAGKVNSSESMVLVSDDYDEIDYETFSYVDGSKWVFDYWVADDEDSTQYNPGDTYAIDADVTLTASFHSEDISTKPVLPTATKAGYTLEGWYTGENGTGEFAGLPGQEIEDLDERPLMIFPNWTEDTPDPVVESATFVSGSAFNESLVKVITAKFEAEGSDIAALGNIGFHRTENAPAEGVYSEDVSEAQDGSILLYVENGDVVWYSPAETVYMNADASYMFQTDMNLPGHAGYHTKAFVSIDLAGIDSSNTTDMNHMFYGGASVGGAIYTDSIKTAIDLSALNTANVTNMESMFHDFSAETLDVSTFDTSNVTNMDRMFMGMQNLTAINVNGFNTAKVTSMTSMFGGDSALAAIDLASFNTAKVTDMSYMFSDCRSLASLDLTSFNTKNVMTMVQMFENCSGLTSLDVTSFKTNPEGIYNGMFKGCASLETLDVSSLDFSGEMQFNGGYTGRFYVQSMFEGMTALKELDLSNWKTVQCDQTMANRMFANCPNLETIWVSRKWKPLGERHENMFEGDVSLVGIKGTAYDENHLNGDYAHIDEGEDNPGYLSMVTYTVHYVNNDIAENVPADQSKDPEVAINLSDYVPEGLTSSTRKDVGIYPDYDTISKTGIYFITTVTDVFDHWISDNGLGQFRPGARYEADMNMTLTAVFNENTEIVKPTLPSATKDGYRLMGWYTGADGTGTLVGYAGDEMEYAANLPQMIYPYWVSEEQTTNIKIETYVDDELYSGDAFRFEIRNKATYELLGTINHFENGVGETDIIVSNFEDTEVIIKQVAGDNEMMNYDMNSFTKVIEKKA